MAQNPETRIVAEIMKYLKSLDGSFWFKVHGSAVQMAGLPDIIGCFRGHFVGFEVKGPGKGPSALQRYRIQQIRDAGGHATTIYKWQDAEYHLITWFSRSSIIKVNSEKPATTK